MKTATFNNDLAKVNALFHFFDDGTIIRVEKEVAKHVLKENMWAVRASDGGKTRYLQIKDLGLGVCGIRLAPIGSRCTAVVKRYTNDPIR